MCAIRESIVVLLACLAGACASHNVATTTAAGGSAGGSGCQLSARDSAFVASEPVYRDCAVDKKANLTNPDVRPDPSAFTSAGRPSGSKCYAVELEFVVNTHGAPEVGTARIVRTTDQSFADAWIKTLSSWKYEPALRGGKPVRQIVDEHRSAATETVVVPRGSTPMPPNTAGRRAPTC